MSRSKKIEREEREEDCRIGSKGLVITCMGLLNIIWIIIAIIIIIILLRFLLHLLFILPTISGAEEEIVNTYKSISAILS